MALSRRLNPTDQEYHSVLDYLAHNASQRGDRTGVGTYGSFGHQMRFDMHRNGFPILTTKKVHFKSVVVELLWMLRGDTNIKYLHDHGVTIWDEWRQPYSLNRDVVVVERRESIPTGYSGNYSTLGVNASVGTIDARLADNWVRMMRRCYDPTHHGYAMYGGSGATVHKQWHDPKVFIADVRKIPHWWYKEQNPDLFELDKDYYGANQYGPNTCVWLRTDENNWYAKTTKPVIVTDNHGASRVYLSQAEAARRIGMSHAAFARICKDGWPTMLKGANKKFEGWEFTHPDKDQLLRLALIPDNDLGAVYGKQWRSWLSKDGTYIDQIKQVIEDLRNNPFSRRHIVTAWNPAEIDDMALPPCHVMFQFYVREDDTGRYLDCHLYQRSADWFLGVPFNMAQYALLTHLIAREVGMNVGRFIHSFGDYHLYTNHRDQALEQLSRTSTRSEPRLIIDAPETASIFELVPDQIRLEGYEPHPSIKAPVAV